jgi:predicted ATPase
VDNQTILAAVAATVSLVSVISAILTTYINRRSEKQRIEKKLEELEKEKLEVEIRGLKEDDFAKFEQIKQIREEKSQFEFNDNLGRTFILKSLSLEGISFFENCEWTFRPGVNILLGRNGYGKSLILRTLTALLQRDDDKSQDLLIDSRSSVELSITRDGEIKSIRRQFERYTASAGKISILAIPDSRFVDRSRIEIKPSGESYDDLSVDGAYHFLHQLPYGGIIDSFLYEICLDYWEHGRSFKLPVFRLLEDVVERLGGDRFSFSEITRVGREKFKIMVVTEGTETPLPIQYASQGTLSVLTLFGLIRSFLKSVFGEIDKLNEQPAIVIIDEADAHLHPKWQQSLIELLREFFPRIQFIISAHSPLMVAGCLEYEVAVLGRSNRKYYLRQLNRDFVGATAQELYSDLFDIDEPDDSLVQNPSWKPMDKGTLERLRQLDEKADAGNLNPLEDIDMERLERKEKLRGKVAVVIDKKKEETDKVFELEAEKARLKARIHELENNQDAQGKKVQP